MKTSLDGRVAIVAGASGGIGSATVRAMLACGMNVVIAAPQDRLLDAIAGETAQFGARVCIAPTDITNRRDVDIAVARALTAYGRIDALVNVAGIGSSPSLAESTDDEIERVLAVNLLGAARMIHAVLPVMIAQRSGAIVNVGSIAGDAGVMGIYSASKFGLRGLTDTLRREMRQYGVGVTLIQPGFVATPMNASMNGLPGPEIVAGAILSAVARPRRRIVVPRVYQLPIFFVKAFPGLTDLVFGDRRIQERLNRDARAERAAQRS